MSVYQGHPPLGLAIWRRAAVVVAPGLAQCSVCLYDSHLCAQATVQIIKHTFIKVQNQLHGTAVHSEPQAFTTLPKGHVCMCFFQMLHNLMYVLCTQECYICIFAPGSVCLCVFDLIQLDVCWVQRAGEKQDRSGTMLTDYMTHSSRERVGLRPLLSSFISSHSRPPSYSNYLFELFMLLLRMFLRSVFSYSM